MKFVLFGLLCVLCFVLNSLWAVFFPEVNIDAALSQMDGDGGAVNRSMEIWSNVVVVPFLWLGGTVCIFWKDLKELLAKLGKDAE